MSLFAIGDLHLAIGEPDKTMEAFGGRWIGYVDKIRRGFELLHEDDTCVICGDFCWAMSLSEALPDFQFLNSLPGKIPLIGKLFVGEKGGGLIGVAYSVKGLLPNPEISVNPLSALAPGAARNLFN